jgi:hypothetical protein
MQQNQVVKIIGGRMAMAKINDGGMLEELSIDMDSALLKWLTTYEIPGLNLTAVMLARLTHLAKQGNYTDDFLRLLEAPKDIVVSEEIKPQVH